MSKVLVLGAYGLIGAACVAVLKARGHDVIGFGRSRRAATRAHPDINWIVADLATTSVEAWRCYLEGVDVVVNAAGALQDGARDRVDAVHETAVRNLCDAARGSDLRFIQISAAGVSTDASTAFFRSKARGDAVLQASDLKWTILRPTLVIGRDAYGGTALLRGLAGLPLIRPRVFELSPVQTVALDEAAAAVADCIEGRIPARRVYDLTEAASRSFVEVVAEMRTWLGFPPFAARAPVPSVALRLCGWIGDGLGWLGWRVPVRTTAIRVMAQGVTGDPTAWREAGGRDFRPLAATLASIPATTQERWFARVFLLTPFALATLSLFWIASGAIGIWRFDAAVAILTERGVDGTTARAVVAAGCCADILLGCLVLVRRWARCACIGMASLSVGYLVAATIWTPDLWADPLGPMIKVLPSIGLALIAWALLEDR